MYIIKNLVLKHRYVFFLIIIFFIQAKKISINNEMLFDKFNMFNIKTKLNCRFFSKLNLKVLKFQIFLDVNTGSEASK